VQAAVSDSGPLDLLAQHDHGTLRGVVEMFLGGPPTGNRRADYQRASPLTHVKRNTPPLLLIYGAADEQVPVVTADDRMGSRVERVGFAWERGKVAKS